MLNFTFAKTATYCNSIVSILVNVKKTKNAGLRTGKHFAMSKKGCTFAAVFVEKNDADSNITINNN